MSNTERILLMKLLKKLLPVATIAGVAAVVAPLVTSCNTSSNNNTESTWTVTTETSDDLTVAPYELSAGEEVLTDRVAVTKFYLDKVSKNKQILVSDMISEWKLLYGGPLPYGCNEATVTVGNIDVDNLAMSYDIEYDYGFNQTNSAYYLFGCQVRNFQFMGSFNNDWNLTNVVDFLGQEAAFSYLKHCFVDWSITIQHGMGYEFRQEWTISRESTEDEIKEFFAFITTDYPFCKDDSMMTIKSDYLKNMHQ